MNILNYDLTLKLVGSYNNCNNMIGLPQFIGDYSEVTNKKNRHIDQKL